MISGSENGSQLIFHESDTHITFLFSLQSGGSVPWTCRTCFQNPSAMSYLKAEEPLSFEKILDGLDYVSQSLRYIVQRSDQAVQLLNIQIL